MRTFPTCLEFQSASWQISPTIPGEGIKNFRVRFLQTYHVDSQLKSKIMTELKFRIYKDKNTIIHYLTDADKFVSVHPLIYKMENSGKNRYKVFEKVDFGFIPYRFTYYALITHDIDHVKIVATVMGITKISMVFTFLEEGGLTIIKEKITVKSPLPIKNYMVELFRKQHQILFSNIEKL
jgi:carbon monoxide dehydrogenase subunit G